MCCPPFPLGSRRPGRRVKGSQVRPFPPLDPQCRVSGSQGRSGQVSGVHRKPSLRPLWPQGRVRPRVRSPTQHLEDSPLCDVSRRRLHPGHARGSVAPGRLRPLSPRCTGHTLHSPHSSLAHQPPQKASIPPKSVRLLIAPPGPPSSVRSQSKRACGCGGRQPGYIYAGALAFGQLCFALCGCGRGASPQVVW